MKNIDINGVYRAIADEPIVVEAFRAALRVQTSQPTRTPARPVGEPYPHLREASLMTCTFQDNGEPTSRRFKLTFEGWTDDPSAVRLSRPEWKKSVTLRSRDETRKQLVRLNKRQAISEA